MGDAAVKDDFSGVARDRAHVRPLVDCVCWHTRAAVPDEKRGDEHATWI